MDVRASLASGRPQYLTLWLLAITFLAAALLDVPLLGHDPATLAILAAVFAAVTTVYAEN